MKKIPFLILMNLAFQMQAQLITYGSFVEPSEHNFENATKLEIEATINEYDWQNNNFYENFRFDFNGIFFRGDNGWDTVAFAIQSLIHEFTPGEIGSRFANPPTINVNNGVGLYLTRLRADLPYESGGIMLLSDPAVYPGFSHTFENVDDLGTLAQNVYTRDNIFENYSFPLRVKWTVTRTGFVTNPTGNLSKNDQDEWVSLVGEYAVWNFKIQLNESEFNVADYYILKENGEFLDTFRPVTLGQEHFGRINEPLGNFKTEVNYKYFRISNNIDCSLINDWRIFRKIEWPEGGNIDERYGWYSNGTELVSSSSHDTDSQIFRDVGTALNVIPLMEHLCHQDLSDDDSDGIVNILDQCPNTLPGQTVDENGCMVFSYDAFTLYTESTACPGIANGQLDISVSAETDAYVFDVQVESNDVVLNYEDQLSFNSALSISDLASGTYNVTISSENGFNMVFDQVVISETGDLIADKQGVNATSKTVLYKLSGNLTYSVSVNQKVYSFMVDNKYESVITVPLEKGENSITIRGADCQSVFKDQIVMPGIVLYPNPVSNGFYISGSYIGKAALFANSGKFVKEVNVKNGNYIDIQELPAGVYFVHFKNGNREILKIIKQ